MRSNELDIWGPTTGIRAQGPEARPLGSGPHLRCVQEASLDVPL